MNNIRKYRIEKGYTLETLARLIGISTSYLCHLEKGIRNNPSCRIMKKISIILQKNITELFDI